MFIITLFKPSQKEKKGLIFKPLKINWDNYLQASIPKHFHVLHAFLPGKIYIVSWYTFRVGVSLKRGINLRFP